MKSLGKISVLHKLSATADFAQDVDMDPWYVHTALAECSNSRTHPTVFTTCNGNTDRPRCSSLYTCLSFAPECAFVTIKCIRQSRALLMTTGQNTSQTIWSGVVTGVLYTFRRTSVKRYIVHGRGDVDDDAITNAIIVDVALALPSPY